MKYKHSCLFSFLFQTYTGFFFRGGEWPAEGLGVHLMGGLQKLGPHRSSLITLAANGDAMNSLRHRTNCRMRALWNTPRRAHVERPLLCFLQHQTLIGHYIYQKYIWRFDMPQNGCTLHPVILCWCQPV